MLQTIKRYAVSKEEARKLKRRVKGIGGWQSLCRRLRSHLTKDSKTLCIPRELYDRLVRYGGLLLRNGGWQGRVPEKLRQSAIRSWQRSHQ